MSGHGHTFLHVVKESLEKMPPLKDEKNPFVAAIMAFLFGPLGSAIYFASLLDFFIGLGMIILLTICIPGIGIFPGWLFNAGFAFMRAIASNERNGY